MTDKLVVGATFAGMGMALAEPDRVLIVEPSGSIGSEFISALVYGTRWNKRHTHPLVQELDRELRIRNAMDDEGRVHLPAVLPLVCRQLLSSQIQIRLMTRPISFERDGDSWIVECVSPSGIEHIRASSIIDTTSAGVLPAEHGGPRFRTKSINVSLYDRSDKYAADDLREVGYRIEEGRFPGEVVWSLLLDRDEGWAGVRGKIGKAWAERPERLRSWTIAATATAFQYTIDAGMFPLGERLYRFPSAGFENALCAMDEGLARMNNSIERAGGIE